MQWCVQTASQAMHKQTHSYTRPRPLLLSRRLAWDTDNRGEHSSAELMASTAMLTVSKVIRLLPFT